MVKGRALSDAIVDFMGPLAASGTKSNISLRIATLTRQLIDDAATVLGKTRTEFMIESARAQGIDVLLNQRRFVIAPDAYDSFAAALGSPATPDPKLRALLLRKPAWEA